MKVPNSCPLPKFGRRAGPGGDAAKTTRLTAQKRDYVPPACALWQQEALGRQKMSPADAQHQYERHGVSMNSRYRRERTCVESTACPDDCSTSHCCGHGAALIQAAEHIQTRTQLPAAPQSHKSRCCQQCQAGLNNYEDVLLSRTAAVFQCPWIHVPPKHITTPGVTKWS